MCGIFAVFNYTNDLKAFRARAINLSKKIRHRGKTNQEHLLIPGPDWSGVAIVNNNIMCHERLAIVGVDSGAQPLVSQDGNLFLAVNGEIYNHENLRKLIAEKRHMDGKPSPIFQTGSDCEVILHLYEEYDSELLNYLDGMFAFVLYDKKNDRYIAARDHIGIIPLYQGWGNDGNSVWFASEMKSIFEDCSKKLISFEPGTLYDSKTRTSKRWFNPVWFDESYIPKSVSPSIVGIKEFRGNTLNELSGTVQFDPVALIRVREALISAVDKQLMSEVPFGVLLSGGLDSSLIASIAANLSSHAARRQLMGSREGSPPLSGAHGLFHAAPSYCSPKIHSFSIGLPGSPDSIAAKKVAKHIGSNHHDFTFTIDEGLDALRDVIYHLESYDVTTVRASTPMFLLSRKIKAMGVKMVLSGEGSDEIFGGYLYFHQAPSPADLHVECVKRVKLLHTSDCLRANKSTMAWGLEARVPFLDRNFLDVIMNLAPEYKHPKLTERKIEKEILRQAFDVEVEDVKGRLKPYLPLDILWRQKEQFSDGVGYSWIDSLKKFCEDSVSDDEWQKRAEAYPYNTPSTREALFIRRVFEEFFCPPEMKSEEKLSILKTVVRWVPRADWGCNEDPSGRAQAVHSQAYKA